MAKSSDLGCSGRGKTRGIRRERPCGLGGDPAAIAGVLIAAWSALSCGGKSNDGAGQSVEDAAAGGGQNTSATASGGSGSRTTTAHMTGAGGYEQGSSLPHPKTSIGGAANTTRSSGGAASTAPSFGGAASTTKSSGGSSNTATTKSGHSGGSGQSSVGAGMGSAAGYSATQPSAGAGGLPGRLSQLALQPAWQNFNGLWNRLDEVQPGTSTYVPYANAITAEQRDQWIEELTTTLGTVEGLGVLNATEILFLRQITTARIEVMRDGGYRYEMFLHRSPFPFEGEAEDSVTRLEKKLDTLLSLKERCVVEPDAYQAALEQVEREALTFFVFAQLTEEQSPYDMRIEIPTELEGAALLTELDQRIEALRAAAGTDATKLAKIDAMKARLATIQSTVQTLPLFAQMLEPCS